VRRARVSLAGHVFGKHYRYKLHVAVAPRDIQLGPNGARYSPIFDAVVELAHLRDFTLSVGQFLVPWDRQRLISSGSFELVERPIAIGEFNVDRDVGVQVGSNDVGGLGYFRYWLGAFNGEGRDPAELQNGGLLYVARLEALPTGDAASRWDYAEGDLGHAPLPEISLGAGYAYHDSARNDRGVLGSRPSDGGTSSLHLLTFDAVVHWSGVSLMAEIDYRWATRHFGSATEPDAEGDEVPAPLAPGRGGHGWFVQAGYVLGGPLPLGFAARYGRVRGSSGSSLGDADEIGVGPSWYASGHDVKLQLEYARRWSGDVGDGTDAVRSQLTAGF
jgi:hypothetical protein